jgi:glycosyltransferase involved in cell wall biosynthesis
VKPAFGLNASRNVGALALNKIAGRVAILMATKNGAAFLDEQLRSLADQSYPSIDVWVSDDGSTDDTPAILADWRQRWAKGRFEQSEGPRKGFAENFRALVSNQDIEAEYFAFCDQDDLWEPEKLEKAIGWMRGRDDAAPLLFCSRTLTVSECGKPTGQSPLFRRKPSFRNALVQSLAGGNTMVLNRAARDCVATASARTGFVSHDWWAYLLVTGAGGEVGYSATPLVRYRQHAGNQVGANTSWQAKGARLIQLFKGQFADWTDRNLHGLDQNRDLLTPDAIAALDLFASARKGSFVSRIRSLRRSGVYRQTLLGTVVLWTAVAFGWM